MTRFINPTREAFKAIFGLALDRPVHMLNLLQFRATAQVDGCYGWGQPAAIHATQQVLAAIDRFL